MNILLSSYIDQLSNQSIDESRKAILEQLVIYIAENRHSSEAVQLNFICTHNSRRSQMAQIWAQTAAAYYSISAGCFSGGVEVTAFNERAVMALERAGFHIKSDGGTNPVYTISYDEKAPAIIAFSKLYNHETNPVTDFAAVMTCSEADENCPYIPGGEMRIPLLYDDPKSFDGTELETDKYNERCRQIASEMFYVFSQIKKVE